jgi:hypothetical protein
VKFYITIVFILIFNFAIKAQSDSLSVFHEQLNIEALSKIGTYKNALSYNLFQIVRGSALISYERVLTKGGLSVIAGLGICTYDALGQTYFKELPNYYSSGAGSNVLKLGTKLRPLFEIGLKYYTSQFLGGTYVGAELISINNTVKIKEREGSDIIPLNLSLLDYRSNEFKFVFGITNKNDKKFYFDYNIGIGYRFIQFESLALEYSSTINGNQRVYSYKIAERTNQTFWPFTALKMGVRF